MIRRYSNNNIVTRSKKNKHNSFFRENLNGKGEDSLDRNQSFRLIFCKYLFDKFDKFLSFDYSILFFFSPPFFIYLKQKRNGGNI